VRRIREIESGSLRALSYLGAFLLISVFVAIPLIFLNSNLLWGEANQYGRVPIPGREAVHLPAGSVEVTVAAALPGRGNETPELLLPPLNLTMKAKGAQEAPTVTEDIGPSVNANDSEVDTQRTAWKLQVPAEGDYLAVLKGDFTGYGVNAQAWFGREPNPLHGWQVILVAMAITLVGSAVWLLVGAVRRKRKGAM
jgi:cell wall-associated NlpC family hydrolase